MKKYTYTDGGRLFVRITKTTARKAYSNGLRVVLQTCAPAFHIIQK